MQELNPKQKAFCEAYIASGNAKQSAIKAGYLESNAEQTGSRMLRYAHVQAYLDKLSSKSTNKSIISAIERKEWLTKLILSDVEKKSDQLKALDILNKMEGEYIEKLQVSSEMVLFKGEDMLED